MKNSPSCAHVLHKTLNFREFGHFTLFCFVFVFFVFCVVVVVFADDGKEMY